MIPDPLGLLIYSVVAIGLAYVLGHSVISVRPRTFLADLVLFKWPGRRCAPASVGGCGEIFHETEWARSGENFVCPKCATHQQEPERATRDIKPFEIVIEAIECPVCLGVHVGWLTALLFKPLVHVGPLPVDVLVMSFFTAGSNLLLARVVGLYPPKDDADGVEVQR